MFRRSGVLQPPSPGKFGKTAIIREQAVAEIKPGLPAPSSCHTVVSFGRGFAAGRGGLLDTGRHCEHAGESENLDHKSVIGDAGRGL